jgi:transposase
VRLVKEIRGMGFTGSVDIVRRYLNELDSHRFPEKATVRFETPPGEQAQVDWAYIGTYMDGEGRLRKVYAFVMVLCFSRMLYVEFTRGMRIEELIRCHQNAFEYFGGWTHTILYDNMAQVRLPSGKLNPLMVDFLSHHGISLKTCQPYRARTKGKVERTIRYLRGNFLKGREFADLADLQVQGTHWQEEVANKRIHDTTRARPIDLFREEKLVPLGSAPRYFVSKRLERTVSAEGFVHVSGSRYSVPPLIVGKKVVVEQGEQKVVVRSGEIIIAEHERARRSGECVADPKHVAEMWKLSLRRQEVPPKPAERLLFQAVEARPLAIYEEVLA